MTTAEIRAELERMKADALLWPVKHELAELRVAVDALVAQVARLQAERVVVLPFRPPEASA